MVPKIYRDLSAFGVSQKPATAKGTLRGQLPIFAFANQS